MLIHRGQIEIVEYKGQRVVSLATIDRVHQRPAGTARKAFNYNKTDFIPETDFFVVSPHEPSVAGPSEFRTGLSNIFSANNFSPTTLMTESGYLMVVKSFKDDLAWKVQRDLVTMYFKAMQLVPSAALWGQASGYRPVQPVIVRTKNAVLISRCRAQSNRFSLVGFGVSELWPT